MTDKARILIVEDDENLRVALADNLEAEGYRVSTAETGAAAEEHLATSSVDLVLLDLMLPDIDGYHLCRRLRASRSDVRILMLTARALDEDVVRGFDVGADDYVTKPYRLALLLARIRALLRRGASPEGANGGRVSFGDFSLDPESRVVLRSTGESVDLTRKEFDLLHYLLRNAGRALGRQEILEEVWGSGIVVDERTVDNFVSSLKKKLGRDASAGFRIATVRGIGYRFEMVG